MSKFNTHISNQHKIHVPTTIRKELDTKKVVLFSGIKIFIVYPEDAELEDVLSSLLLIQNELEQRLVNEDHYNGKIESMKLNDTEKQRYVNEDRFNGNRNGSSNKK